MRIKLSEIVLAGVAILFMGCATSRPFQPANNAREILDKGPSFARYEVRTGILCTQIDVSNDSSKTILLDAERLAVHKTRPSSRWADGSFNFRTYKKIVHGGVRSSRRG